MKHEGKKGEHPPFPGEIPRGFSQRGKKKMGVDPMGPNNHTRMNPFREKRDSKE